MGIGSSIRNFFYAATHADQLVNENQRLQQEVAESSTTITMQMTELREAKENLGFMERHQERLRSALEMLAPKDPSLGTLRDLYIAVKGTTYDCERAGQYLLGHQWYARYHIQDLPIWDAIEKEIYRIVLNQADILPYHMDFTVQNQLQEQVIKAIGEKVGAEQIPANMPVGRIDYLCSNGTVRESLEYRDAGKLIADALHSGHYGEPMSITVYSNPKTGAHIDTGWRLALYPLQGFQIVPYQESQQTIHEPIPESDLELEL